MIPSWWQCVSVDLRGDEDASICQETANMLRNACDGSLVDGDGDGPCDGDPCPACVGERNGVSNPDDAAACAAQNGRSQSECEAVMTTGLTSPQPACTWSPASRAACAAAGDQCVYT